MMQQASLTSRMQRAAMLDVSLYEEVERDENATTQALFVVIIVALASAIGGALDATLSNRPGALVGNALGGILAALVGWVIWSGVTYFIGTQILRGTATYGELLRTIGFAQSPGVLLVLRFIPVLGGLIALAVAIWQLVAGVVAIRQALDVTTGQAIVTVLLGWLAYVVFAAVLALLGLGAAFLAG
jgi:hypothetical protein